MSEDVRAIDVVNLSAFECENGARLVSATRACKNFVPDLSLVAELNGCIVGHLLLSKIRLERGGGSKTNTILALGPMSVVPVQPHRGIGSSLIQAAVRHARGMRYPTVVVAGHFDCCQRFDFLLASHWALSANPPCPDGMLTTMELTDGFLKGGGSGRDPEVFAEILRSCA